MSQRAQLHCNPSIAHHLVDLAATLSQFFRSVPGDLLVQGIAVAAVTYLLLIAFDRWLIERRAGPFAITLAGLLAVLGLAACVYVTIANFLVSREWDFLCFWTYGRALASGDSPYNVEILRELAEPLSPSEDFLRLTYCLYPPPCVVQFLPLGFFPPSTARVLWYVVQWCAAFGSVGLVWRMLDPSRCVVGLLVTTALFFSLRATISTFGFAQTNFLVLLLLLAYHGAGGRAKQGLLLGFATLVKPIAAIIALDLLIRRRWSALAAMLVPAFFGLALFVVIQGMPGIEQYLHRNPLSEEIAQTFYTEKVNQSLLATLLRVTVTPPGARPVFYPPFVLLAGALTAISAVVVWRLGPARRPLGIAVWVALALLVYPGALGHYSVLLLLPIALLWQHKEDLPGGAHAVALCAALTYGLVWSRLGFAANLSVWLFTVVAFSRLDISRGKNVTANSGNVSSLQPRPRSEHQLESPAEC